ncbi:MAG TPA: DnaA regulatory inactivator Hda [Gammaproteobacteria bacterium]|nr:DnaA regulatory inactivator Hda [Gammaproteobacteria bacterium]
MIPFAQHQLALSLTFTDGAELTNFVVGKNSLALERVKLAASGLGEFILYVWGATSVGKTHLLQGACNAATLNHGLSAIYIPLRQYKKLKVQDLAGLEQLDLVCLDDIEHICGDPIWEEAIFYLYNRMRALNKHLLVASNGAASHLSCGLLDLKTRLGWGEIYHLESLSDDEKMQALKVRAQQRGLLLSNDVLQYIFNRSNRSMGALYQNLEILDKASLTLQRKLTIPFVKKILNM